MATILPTVDGTYAGRGAPSASGVAGAGYVKDRPQSVEERYMRARAAMAAHLQTEAEAMAQRASSWPPQLLAPKEHDERASAYDAASTAAAAVDRNGLAGDTVHHARAPASPHRMDGGGRMPNVTGATASASTAADAAHYSPSRRLAGVSQQQQRQHQPPSGSWSGATTLHRPDRSTSPSHSVTAVVVTEALPMNPTDAMSAISSAAASAAAQAAAAFATAERGRSPGYVDTAEATSRPWRSSITYDDRRAAAGDPHMYAGTLSSSAAGGGTAYSECAGCARLRGDVHDLRETVASLEATLARVTFSVRALTNREASLGRPRGERGWEEDDDGAAAHEREGGQHQAHRRHMSSSPSPPPQTSASSWNAASAGANRTPPPKDEYEAELQRSDALRSRAGAAEAQQSERHFQATSPLLRDQQNLVAVKAELRVFEKRMLTSLTKLANRIAAVEGDNATVIETNEALQEALAKTLHELSADKVSRGELKQLVLPIVDTARDITAERVGNIYELLGWPEARVQQAIVSRDPDRITDAVFSSPPLARLVDGLVRTSNDVQGLREELHHLHHIRMVDGPVLGSKQRFLGLAVDDELELRGVRVSQVFAGGPGHLAGFRVGDVITTVNRVHVTCKADFLRVMSSVLPNTVVRITRIGDGRRVADEVEVIAAGELTAGTGAPLY
jgi:hypothetical protein